ncbi:gamma-glutamyltransferase 2. Threonine peptidase. MEROPS family T03 [Tistlia consotensis]|uniref:Gamma-glutamyltransferase 2. Threonine peptidase. MEROPS family T03 n=1 Tax=Tistlia consotensis USBA 355 TaxID=560819 RepID=A0A1Y6BZP9_9PROT|nr:gamma-glutamyltransferase family protein [Tistlia consotensis]SMF38235.1 gamma-glutamyltransferase 2. Threonine peptidase. MEROPS family T03 [Tistlia consotensis USBA 355]SNR37280.1 gamma-glutamyltransferase 2. Threonine peptidase. MEROPS family T03 [Tistlia consotensis]
MSFTTRPELRGTFGAVGSTHWLASAVAMSVLEQGGNAFDAAVAGGFTLQVVEPHLNGLGGEVPIVLRAAAEGRVRILCGQGTAPAGATIAHYRGEGLDMVPGAGFLATVVPGAFDAWLQLLRDYGTLPPREVLKYAIGYARDGYPLVPLIRATIERVEKLFREEWPSSAALYLPGGDLPTPGRLFRNPTLADTYERLLAEGEAAGAGREAQIEGMRRAWSQGFVAESLERFCRAEPLMDSSGQRHRGVLAAQDLAGWQASYEAPLTYDFHGWTVCKGGPWSQGPVLLQQLALLKGFDLKALDPAGPDFVHLVTEAAKLAFADREAYYGDPDFVSVPMETLLSDAYNDERRKLIGERASLELRPGRVAGYEANLEGLLAQRGGDEEFDSLGGGEPTVQTGGVTKGDTCHIDVIDRWGNMVGATPSGGWLQSSPVVPELGFCLNSRGQMFWLEEGQPSTLEPGKRPRSTLSVNLVLREGEPYMVFGTPGGDYQDQWSLGLFLRHACHGLNLQEAIDHPSFQTDHMPSSFWPRNADLGSLAVEGRFPPQTVTALTARGHRVEVREDWSLGRLSAVAREPGGLLKAAANPRFMQGYAIAR